MARPLQKKKTDRPPTARRAMATSKGAKPTKLVAITAKKQPDAPRPNTDRPLAQMQRYGAKCGSLLLVPACALATCKILMIRDEVPVTRPLDPICKVGGVLSSRLANTQ